MDTNNNRWQLLGNNSSVVYFQKDGGSVSERHVNSKYVCILSIYYQCFKVLVDISNQVCRPMASII